MRTSLGLAILGFLALSGCATTASTTTPTSLNDLDQRTLITGREKVRIALAPGIPERVESLGCDFVAHYRFKGPVITGLAWHAVFIGSAGDPVLTIINSSITCTNTRSAKFVYHVSARVDFKGKSYPIETSGARNAMSAKENALRQAIEKTVLSTAEIADASLRGQIQQGYQ